MIESRTSPSLVAVIGNACLLILKLDTQVIPIVSTSECRIVSNFWRHDAISIKYMSLRYLLFDPHWATYQSKIGVWEPLHAWDWEPDTSSTLSGVKGGAGPSSLHTTLEGPIEHVNARCKVYMDYYVASNGPRFMVTWTFCKNHLLEASLTKTGRPWHSRRSQPLIYWL